MLKPDTHSKVEFNYKISVNTSLHFYGESFTYNVATYQIYIFAFIFFLKHTLYYFNCNLYLDMLMVKTTRSTTSGSFIISERYYRFIE